MRSWFRDLFFTLITIVGLPAAMSGIVPDVPYHQVECDPAVCWSVEDGKKRAAIPKVRMYVGNYGWDVEREQKLQGKPWTDSREVTFDRAWLEFNDAGKLHLPAQLEAILKKIAELGSDKKSGEHIAVVTFIHGWHHNASTDVPVSLDPGSVEAREPNAIKADYFFARQVDQIRRLREESNTPAPKVLAIYVGWRGESYGVNGLNILTIANRAKVADTLASSGGLAWALGEISKALVAADEDGRMLVAGHSLGGRALAMAFREDVANKQDHPLRKNALIALIEPAIGAACFSSIFKKHDGPVKPFMINVSSGDDAAIGWIYELGSAVGSRVGIPSCDGTTNQTIGNYLHYVTHALHFDQRSGDDFVQLDPKPGFAVRSHHVVFPVNIRAKPWFRETGVRHLAYSWHGRCFGDGKGNRCWQDDNDIYEMTFDAVGPKNSRFWNIQTDRNTIDSEDNPSKVSGLHNFVSTNLARLFAEFLYLE